MCNRCSLSCLTRNKITIGLTSFGGYWFFCHNTCASSMLMFNILYWSHGVHIQRGIQRLKNSSDVSFTLQVIYHSWKYVSTTTGMTFSAWVFCGVVDYDLMDFYRISFWWNIILSQSYHILLETSWEARVGHVQSSLIQVHDISRSGGMGLSSDRGLQGLSEEDLALVA